MLELKDSRWAHEIVSLQSEEGNWGYFHTLSNPTKSRPMTTEQALRRLQILGFSIDDLPIKKAVSYLHDCLTGAKQIPDRREKLHNWDIFTPLMFSTWIRRFTLDDALANQTASLWAEILGHAFMSGIYDHNRYVKAYHQVFNLNPRGGRLIDFVNFYLVSILSNLLDEKSEQSLFDYLLNHESGIYYIYGESLSHPPQDFQSKQASRYLGAIELLAAYHNPHCKAKLKFVGEWLDQNRDPDGLWDMGSSVKDGIYFPLSDSWRTIEARKQDCTYRITKLISNLGLH